MFTKSELSEIDERLARGETPEEIAGALSLKPGTLRYRLLQSGKQIEVTMRRRLVDTAPMDAAPLGVLVDARA